MSISGFASHSVEVHFLEVIVVDQEQNCVGSGNGRFQVVQGDIGQAVELTRQRVNVRFHYQQFSAVQLRAEHFDNGHGG